MKPLLQLLMCAALAIVLCACPYGSAYKLDDEPTQPVDKSLLGKWAAFVKKPRSEKEEPVKIIFTQKSEMVYNIAITGYINELRPAIRFTGDSIKGEAFISMVENKPVLNVLVSNKNYLCEVQKENRSLSLLPLSEHFTAKLVKSNAVLRTALEFHYKTRLRAMYDEEFCVKNLVKVN